MRGQSVWAAHRPVTRALGKISANPGRGSAAAMLGSKQLGRSFPCVVLSLSICKIE